MPARIHVVNRYCDNDYVAGAAVTFDDDLVTAKSPRTGANRPVCLLKSAQHGGFDASLADGDVHVQRAKHPLHAIGQILGNLGSNFPLARICGSYFQNVFTIDQVFGSDRNLPVGAGAR